MSRVINHATEGRVYMDTGWACRSFDCGKPARWGLHWPQYCDEHKKHYESRFDRLTFFPFVCPECGNDME